MSKLSFKQFLIEVDVGDLQLTKQAREQDMANAADAQARGGFKEKMTAASPSQGDVIQTKTGMFIVAKMSPDGILVQQAGGQKTAMLPHGTKFKPAGKAPSGKPMFVIAR